MNWFQLILTLAYLNLKLESESKESIIRPKHKFLVLSSVALKDLRNSLQSHISS